MPLRMTYLQTHIFRKNLIINASFANNTTTNPNVRLMSEKGKK